MDIVKLAIMCGECSSFLVKPVMLPCGSSVCHKHLENLDNQTFFCKLCEVDHHIEKSYMNINKGLEVLINANLENLNLGSDYKAAVNLCKEYHQAIKNAESITNDPTVFIRNTIDQLKNTTEIIREEHKLKIDDKANEIIEILDRYRAECENNLNSADMKTKITKISENIVKIKESLASWEKTLTDFGSDEKEWTEIKQNRNKCNLKLYEETCDFKKALLLEKFKDFFSCVSNFPEIKLTSDTKLDTEMKEFIDILINHDTSNSKIIDQTKKLELLTLCNISPEKKWRLIYQGSEHGFLATDFHAKCDNIPNTLTIVKSTKGFIFGGYTSQSWDQSNTYKNDSSAYLFSLVNPQNQPQKLMTQNASNAIYCHSSYGPTFGSGHDLIISDSSDCSNLGNSYPMRYFHFPNNDHKRNQSYFTESQKFAISDIDVYQLV